MKSHAIFISLFVLATLTICTEAAGKRRKARNGNNGNNGGNGNNGNNMNGRGGVDVLEINNNLKEEHRNNPGQTYVPLPDGAVLTEGDILISQDERVRQVQNIIDGLEDKRKKKEAKERKRKASPAAISNGPRRQRNNRRKNRRNKRALTRKEGYGEWSKGNNGLVTIQYDASAFTTAEREVIQQSINQYNEFTCVRFVPRFNSAYYIKLIKGSGCWSWLGRTSFSQGFQELSLEAQPNYNCVNVGTVLHELGHALGHHHEQNRPDRNNYIQVLTSSSQFNIQSAADVELHNTPYDFRSIMHYSGVGTRFNMLQQTELESIVGRTNVLSFYDIQAVNSRYECSDGCPAANCPPDSFQAADCSCYCFSGNTNNPIVNCGEVCVSVNQECNCAARTDACSGLDNTVCNTGSGVCECISGTYEVDGSCVAPQDIPCQALNSNCLCSLKSTSACNSAVLNSDCDPATNECVCSGRFLELNAGSCTDTNTLPCPLGENCYCNLQTGFPCSSISSSACNAATGACECNSGFVHLEGQTTCTNQNSLSCSVLEQDCGCGALGPNACQGLPNSECDADSGACFCSEDFYNNNGQCTPAPSCSSLNTNCICSVQGSDACSAISNSNCDYASDKCVCSAGYQTTSSTSCDLISDYTLTGQSIDPFVNVGTHDWTPAHVTDSDSPIGSDRTGEGWYLLADGLPNSDTSSKFVLESPDLEGRWCMQYLTRHSHAEMSISVLYFGQSYTYFTYQTPSGASNWWRYTVGMSINGASFRFRLEFMRYNSGEFWAVLDRIRLFQC